MERHAQNDNSRMTINRMMINRMTIKTGHRGREAEN